MQSNKMFITVRQQRTTTVPNRYLWYCGTKKYREGDGTGTVENGTAVPRYYRGTAQHYFVCSLFDTLVTYFTAGDRDDRLDDDVAEFVDERKEEENEQRHQCPLHCGAR